MPMRSDMVIPATKVRSEFTKILPRIIGDNYFTLTYKGYPKYALVDLKYLERLENKKLFEKAFKETSSMFAEYLKSIGKDINTISEEEANEIIWKLAGIN
jgi:hypothetical protein